MGLDMYLYAKMYISVRELNEDEKSNEKFNKLVELSGLNKVFITTSSTVEIGYWRKANAIHKYFVDKCASGVDECQEIYVDREELVKLKDICGQLSLTKDVEQAKELLPPQSGFFFGSTEIDEYYFHGIEYTYNLLNKILEKISEDDCDYEFIYRYRWLA